MYNDRIELKNKCRTKQDAKLVLHQNCHICRTMQIEAKTNVKIACIIHLNYVAFTQNRWI